MHPQLAVSDVLRCWHETIPVFLRHHMACLGCPMACFETLQGAAAVYGLDPDAFVAELEASITASTHGNAGAADSEQ
jgi:hybrid cluster-associated redox disulfide protein